MMTQFLKNIFIIFYKKKEPLKLRLHKKWKVTDIMEYFLTVRKKFLAEIGSNIYFETPINKEAV